MPKRYPITRCFAMAALILVTIVAVTGVLEWQDQQDSQLWSVEQAPHPWPWPGQERWPRPIFDFKSVFERTAIAAPRTAPDLEPTATFVHDLLDPQDVLSSDYRWAFVNLRGDQGSIRIDRETPYVLYCPHAYRSWGIAVDPERSDRWCDVAPVVLVREAVR